MNETVMSLILLVILVLLMSINLMLKSAGMMCVNLIIYTGAATIIMSNIIKLTLISFIIMLTMIGGLMILYLYFTTSNKHFTSIKFNKNLNLLLVIPFISILMCTFKTLNMNPSNLKTYNFNNDQTEKMFIAINETPTIILILTLLITLVSVIKICSQINAPVRRKFKA